MVGRVDVEGRESMLRSLVAASVGDVAMLFTVDIEGDV
jgi:hypothetical protein